MDICQSVMASFFVRAALGQYQLNTPEQLLNLLAFIKSGGGRKPVHLTLQEVFAGPP